MKKFLIVFAVLLLLPSLSWGWDAWNPGPSPNESAISTMMRIKEERRQQERRDIEDIGTNLGNIFRERAQRRAERDAIDAQRLNAAPRRQLQSEAEMVKSMVEEIKEREKGMSPEEKEKCRAQSLKEWDKFIDNYYGVGR